MLPKLLIEISVFCGKEVKMSELDKTDGGLVPSEKLNSEELVRSIRYMISAEYGATQLYQDMAQRSGNSLAQETLSRIANEERAHAKDLVCLLRKLAPEEEKFYKEDYQELDRDY
jgi:rubrerythrin